METMEPTFENIVRVYMTAVGGKQISIRRFVKQMNEPLTKIGITGFTHQAVYNWLAGKHKPSKRGLTTLKSASSPESWQYKFSSDLLKVLEQ